MFSAALGAARSPRPEPALPGSTPALVRRGRLRARHVALGGDTVARLQDGALGAVRAAGFPPPPCRRRPAAARRRRHERKPGPSRRAQRSGCAAARLRIALTARRGRARRRCARARFRTRTVALRPGGSGSCGSAPTKPGCASSAARCARPPARGSRTSASASATRPATRGAPPRVAAAPSVNERRAAARPSSSRRRPSANPSASSSLSRARARS